MILWQNALLSIIGSSIAGIGFNEIAAHGVAMREREQVLSSALSYARSVGRPLLVIGTPEGRHACGDVTLDLRPLVLQECPKSGFIGSLYELARYFQKKEFGASTIMHVLEHLDDPPLALEKALIVSDRVYFAGPPQNAILAGWLYPGHIAMGWWRQFKNGFKCTLCNADLPYLSEIIQCEGCGTVLDFQP